MRESVPSASYSSVCNVLRQWNIPLIPTYRVYRLYDYCWSADTNCWGGGSGTDEPQHPEQAASVGRIVSDQRPGNAGTSDKEKFSHVDNSELSRLLK